MPDLAAPPAPAAAPAAPVSSAPAPAAPVAPAVETPSAAPVAVPAAAPESGAPAAAAPAAPAATGKPEPKAADFGNDIEGFLKAHNEWESEQQPAAAPAEGEPKVEEPAAAAEPEKPAEEAKPEEKPAEEQPKASLEDEHPDLTPEALQSLIKENPDLGALLEANPKLNGTFQKMARVNAKAAPMLEIFPTVQSAKFAQETSNKMVGMRTAFQMAIEEPERLNEAMDMFLDEFKVKGADGKFLMESDGVTPQLAPDFDLLSDHLTNLRLDGSIADIEARLEADKYANEDAKDNDAAALQAYKFIKLYEQRNGEDAAAKPDLSKLDPETRAYYEAKDKEIAEREAKLGDKTRQQSKEERKAARATYEKDFRSKFGGTVGKFATTYVQDLIKQGVHVPRYALEMKDPKTGVSIFAVNVFNNFNKWFNSVSEQKQHAAELQMLPPGEDSMNQRLGYYRGIINEHLPRFINAEIRKIQGAEKADRDEASTGRKEAEKVANVEPRGGSVRMPQPLTDEQAYAQAVKDIDADPKSASLSDQEKMVKILERRNQLRRGGR